MFDHEGHLIHFDKWLDDLQMYLLSDSRGSVSLFDHTSGTAPAPPATADSATRSQWLTRNAAARLALRNHLPLAECANFGQHRTTQELYDTVVARYSSPATAALGRLLLPYLFPKLSAFATVEDLVSHLCTSDGRYRAALPAEFLAKNLPPMYITLYFIVTRLPDSLRAVRDHFLALDPTDFTVDLLKQHLLAAETSVVAVGVARGTPRTPFFEGCSPSPLAPSYACAAGFDVLGAKDVGAAFTIGSANTFSTSASALVAELVDFAAACRLDYATALVAKSESANPPSVGGECAFGTDVLEDWQEDFECLAASVPRFASMLLAPEGDPDAPDIPTPRSYAEAITGPYSSQWHAAMDAEMASWKSTGNYVDEVPPPGANIVDGMWIFRGVDYFQTFSPTLKMTTLRVLLNVAVQRDYELHSLDFSTAFMQGSLHKEIWLRRPLGFIGTTLLALGFAPSIADPSLFLRTDTSLPPFYILVYVDDLVFATADTEALTLVKSELQKMARRHLPLNLPQLSPTLVFATADDKMAASAQPPPTVPPPFHTPLAAPLAPLPRHPPRTTPSAPTHPPPSAAAAAVGDG
ncbi:unnamed protein product, partial [Closterium sp. NIES-53]